MNPDKYTTPQKGVPVVMNMEEMRHRYGAVDCFMLRELAKTVRDPNYNHERDQHKLRLPCGKDLKWYNERREEALRLRAEVGPAEQARIMREKYSHELTYGMTFTERVRAQGPYFNGTNGAGTSADKYAASSSKESWKK